MRQVKDAAVQQFLQALPIYTRDRNNPGDSQQLFQLLHEARDAQTVQAH